MYMQHACPSVGQVFSLAAEYAIIGEKQRECFSYRTQQRRCAMQRRSYILLGLMLAVLLGVFVCLRMQERTQIDFEQVEPIPGYKMEMREPPLRVAMISVLNHARTEDYQSQMVRSLGRPVLLLHRRSYAEINQLLAKGDADVAFLSSGAYMVYGKKEDVRLLAMPERGGTNYYFSYYWTRMDV